MYELELFHQQIMNTYTYMNMSSYLIFKHISDLADSWEKVNNIRKSLKSFEKYMNVVVKNEIFRNIRRSWDKL